jgi:hypothetical protein
MCGSGNASRVGGRDNGRILLGRELINMPIDGLSESAFEPRAAAKREARHFREVP